MRILNLSKWGTRKARKHPALQGLPILGAGTFCTVFDNGETVLKLTCDDIQYGYSTDYCAPQGRHFPKLIKNHGFVGEQDDLALYLFEVEKLQPIRRNKNLTWRAYNTLNTLLERSAFSYSTLEQSYVKNGGYRNPSLRAKDVSRMTMEALAEDKELTPGIREVCSDLAGFIANYGASLDMHTKNFMLRGKTLVFNDVVCSADILASHRSRRSFA